MTGVAGDPARARVIDDYRPLSEALEARVSAVYWQQRGVLPFAENEVPFIVNNSGRLSDNAASLLLASCLEVRPGGRITVVEYGAGTGLFARHLLDAFRALCAEQGLDFYDRLDFVVTDHSPATVRHWAERRLFDDHRGHVVTQVADAVQGPPVAGPVRAAFCNYVLDVLPAAVVRTGEHGGPEQLWIRTHLVDDAALVKAHTALTLAQIREVAACNDPAALAALFPLVTLFEEEVAFRRAGAAEVPDIRAALESVPAGQPLLLQFGALQCLARTAAALDDGGFVLVNDYGPTQATQAGDRSVSQRFGRTTALGINFPMIEHRSRQLGLFVMAPSDDDERRLHTRMISRQSLPRTVETLERLFGAGGRQQVEAPLADARAHAAAGRRAEALDAYRQMIAHSPRDWRTIGEVADITKTGGDFAGALALADAAIALNPCYSAWLWNARGESLYCLGRYDEAHEAFLEAQRIDPRDARTNTNLSYTLVDRGECGAALQAIARGLEADRRGFFRDRLRRKQDHALMVIAAQDAGQYMRLMRREERLSQPWAPVADARAPAMLPPPAHVSADSGAQQ